MRAPLSLSPGDRRILERWLRSRTTPQGLVRRARIVLLLSDGLSGRAVAERLSVSRHTVDLWRRRYREGGQDALTRDKPGRGRKPRAGWPTYLHGDPSG